MGNIEERDLSLIESVCVHFRKERTEIHSIGFWNILERAFYPNKKKQFLYREESISRYSNVVDFGMFEKNKCEKFRLKETIF